MNGLSIRSCRKALGLSQAEFADLLQVGVETFRIWDSGRRTPSPEALDRARILAETRREVRGPLHVLARELGVHVRTLRAAARDGRLAATFAPRAFFGKLTATATRAAGAIFMTKWYRRTYGRGRRHPLTLCRVTVPANCASVIVGLRLRLGLSQRQLASRVGAANRAVVYQWESGKRRPSPVLWLRILRLQRTR